MLSFKFQLTPAQTKLLLLIAFNVRHQYDPPMGVFGAVTTAPDDHANSHFVPVVKKLEEKGLVSWSPDLEPAHVATEHGTAIAELILRDAQDIVNLAKGREKRAVQWARRARAKRGASR